MPPKPSNMPFSPAEFLLDPKIESMTNEQIGVFILLICRSWVSEHPGYLPKDAETQARWARMPVDAWQHFAGAVTPLFQKDAQGRLYHASTRDAYESAANRKAKLSEAGRKGNLIRHGAEKKPIEPPAPVEELKPEPIPVVQEPDPVVVPSPAPDPQPEPRKIVPINERTAYQAVERQIRRQLTLQEGYALAKLLQGLRDDPWFVGTDEVDPDDGVTKAAELINADKPPKQVIQWLSAVVAKHKAAGTLPGEVAPPTTLSQRHGKPWTAAELCSAITSGKITKCDGVNLPKGRWTYNTERLACDGQTFKTTKELVKAVWA